MATRLSLSRLRLNPNYNALSKFHAGEGSERLRVEADDASSYEEVLQICRHLDLEWELLPSPAGASAGFRRISVRRGIEDAFHDDCVGSDTAQKAANPALLDPSAFDGEFGPAPAAPRQTQKRQRVSQEVDRLLGVYSGPSGLSDFYRALIDAFPGQNEPLAKCLMEELRIALPPHLRGGVPSNSSDSSSSSESSSDSSASTAKKKKRKAKKKAKKKKKKDKQRKGKEKKAKIEVPKLDQVGVKHEDISDLVGGASTNNAEGPRCELAAGETALENNASVAKSVLKAKGIIGEVIAEVQKVDSDAGVSVPDSDIEARHLAGPGNAAGGDDDSEIWSDAASEGPDHDIVPSKIVADSGEADAEPTVGASAISETEPDCNNKKQ